MTSANDIKALREKTGAGFSDCKKALEATNNDMEKAIDWLREKGISSAAKKEARIAAEGLCNIQVVGNTAVIVEVNSETDFVARNIEFQNLCQFLATQILNNDVTDLESVFNLKTTDGTVKDTIISYISKIGEKLSLRRFAKLVKEENQVFGTYLHMGGKIGVLVLLDGNDQEVAKDVAMHIAAMKPSYISRNEISSETLEKEKAIIKEQAINEGKSPEIAEKMITGRINKFYQEVCLLEQLFVKNDDLQVGVYVQNHQSAVKQMIRFEVGEGLEKRCEDFAEEVMKQIRN